MHDVESKIEYDKAVFLWRQKHITSSSELEDALKDYSLTFAYHSCRIENEGILLDDTRNIFNGRASSCTGDIRSLLEIGNATVANDYLIGLFGTKKPLDEGIIKEFQRRLTHNTYGGRLKRDEESGEYKHHDYAVGKYDVGALPQDVPDEMRELLDELSNISNTKALTTAAYFHAKFENIHPFADGNGRTGRITMNYFLLIHNHPPIVIHEEDRNEYYSALEAWDDNQDLTPLISFLKAQTVKTWRNYIYAGNKTA